MQPEYRMRDGTLAEACITKLQTAPSKNSLKLFPCDLFVVKNGDRKISLALKKALLGAIVFNFFENIQANAF